MDFKRRILTTMNHEEPDRVPVMGLLAEPATSNKVLGKPQAALAGMLRDPELKNQIKDIMNSSWNEILYGTFADALEAAVKLGFDANWTTYTLMQAVEAPQSKLGFNLHDVWGRIWELRADEDGEIVVNYVGGFLTTEEEWNVWIETKKPLLDRFIAGAAEHYSKLAANYSDRILPIGYTSVGIFTSTWQSMGFVNFTRFVYQKPDFVKKVIAFLTDFYIKYLDAIMKSDVEVVIGEDDLGQKTGPLFRPELIDKLYGDSYRRVSEFVHKRSKKLIWHSCGNIYLFLDKFVEWGFDGLLTMEPTAGMDLARVREQVGHKLVLVGNLDVSYLLVRGTRQEVEDAVKNSIRSAARGGGYILSQSHTHRAVDPVRLEWMVEAAHKYGKYPISV